jgi:hypothetical protein
VGLQQRFFSGQRSEHLRMRDQLRINRVKTLVDGIEAPSIF